MENTAAVKAVLLSLAVFTLMTTAIAATYTTAVDKQATNGPTDGVLAWVALCLGSTTVSLATGLGIVLSRIVAHGAAFDRGALKTMSLRTTDPAAEFARPNSGHGPPE
jgi:hypothetical protein